MLKSLKSLSARIAKGVTYRGERLAKELAFAARRRFRPVIEVAGMKVPLGKHISLKVLMLLDRGYYEAAELAMLKKYLKPTDKVMEIGAGIGFVSTFCSRVVGEQRVATYEANPRLEKPIRAMHNLNHVHPELNICFLGHQQGTRDLYIHRDFICSTTIPGPGFQTKVSIPVRSFRDELERHHPSFLIIDIEGGEVELLHQTPLSGIRAILLEVHPDIVGEAQLQILRQWLSDQGLQPFDSAGQIEMFARPSLVELTT